MIRTTIYFSRHASTLWNEERRFQGRKNSAISEKGIEQAKLLGTRIRELAPEVLCTSTLQRTKETARIGMQKAGFSLPNYEYAQLDEIFLGNWEGQTVDWVQKNDPEQFVLYTQNPQHFQHPTGEGFKQVLERSLQGIETILSEFSGKRVWVVTHGFVLCTVVAYLRNIPHADYRAKIRLPENAEILHTAWFR